MSTTANDRTAQHWAAQAAARDLRRLSDLHRHQWPAAGPASPVRRPAPKAPAAPQAPQRPSPDKALAKLLEGIPRWRLGERAAARQVAEQLAEEDYQRALAEHQRALADYEHVVATYREGCARIAEEQDAEHRLLQLQHQRLESGDRHTTERAITAALTELPYPAKVTGWARDCPTITVAVPGVEAVPEREPTVTAGGKPSTRKLNQGERNDAHAELVAALTIAAARCALAAAPSVPAALALATHPDGIVGRCRVPRTATTFDKDPIMALIQHNGELEQTGRTRRLTPLDAAPSA